MYFKIPILFVDFAKIRAKIAKFARLGRAVVFVILVEKLKPRYDYKSHRYHGKEKLPRTLDLFGTFS